MGLLRQVVKTGMATLLPPHLFLVRGTHPASYSQQHGTSSDERNRLQVSLTFDDGPHPEHTPRLLDALHKAQFCATFFVIGERAQRYPHLIRRIVEAGHELGNHTFTHREPTEVTANSFLEELQRTRDFLHNLTGTNCRLVRPPKGQLALGKCWSIWKQRQTVVLWNIDSHDYRMKTRTEMDRWCAAYRPSRGDILLMHDNHPYAEFAVNEFAGSAQFAQVEFVPVSYWLKTSVARSIATNETPPAEPLQTS